MLSTPRRSILSSALMLAIVMAGCGLQSGAESGGAGGGGGDTYSGGGPTNATGGKGAGSAESDRAGTGGTPPDTGPAGTGGGALAGPMDLSSCGVTELPATAVTLSVPHARRMSAPEQARAVLLDQHKPPAPGLVSTREFLSYYDIDYGLKPTSGLAVTAQLAPGVLKTQYVLTIGVQAPAPAVPRRPVAITVVVDTSFSMGGAGIERARYAVAALANSLLVGDAFNIVTTNPNVAPLQHVAQVDADPTAVEAANALVPDGGDDLKNAVAVASKLANESLRPGGINRVVLITDGAALPTSLDLDTIAADAKNNDIQLVGVGVGNELGYKSDLITAATEAGRGPSLFINDEAEADKMLHDRFDQTLDVAAREVTVSINVPGMFTIENLEGEGYAVDPTALTVSDLGPGRSMTFRQVLRACSDSVVSANVDAAITIDVRWKNLDGTDGGTHATPTMNDMTNAPPGPAAKAAAIVAVAEALKSLDVSRIEAAKVLVGPGAKNGDPELADLKAQLDAVTFAPTP